MVRKALCKVKAQEVINQLHLTPPPPVDIERVVREWGLAVEFVNRPGGLHGRMLAERAVVEVAAGDHPNRQRFSIAHELGHYILAHNPVYSEAEPEEITSPTGINEREADTFAAELLMPTEWVRDDWKELQHSSRMAALYRVSEQAMWIRLEDLRLIRI
jgi:hypothetical protein